MNCNVCLENLFSKTVVSTSCGHLHHQDCLNRWFQNTKTCPDCRSDQRNETPIQIFFSSSIENSENSNRSVNKKDMEIVVEQVLNSKNKYENKIKEIGKQIELEKKCSSELKKKVESLQNEVRWVEILSKENHHVTEEKNFIQTKLSSAQEYIKEKDESLNLEKHRSLEYKRQLLNSREKVKVLEKENFQLVEKKNSIQSKLNSVLKTIKEKDESIIFEKQQSLEYKTQLEKSINKIKNIGIEIATLRNQIKEVESIKNENLRLVGENEKIVSLADDYKKKIEQNKRYLKLERKKSHNFRKQLGILNNEVKIMEIIKKENILLVEQNKNIQSQLNLIDEYPDKNEDLNNIKIILKNNFELSEEKKAIQLKLNSADEIKKEMEKTKKSLELEKKQSSKYKKQVENLQNLVNKAEIFIKEKTQLIEEKNSIQSKLNSAYENIKEKDESLKFEKQQSLEYKRKLNESLLTIKFLENRKNRLVDEMNSNQSKFNENIKKKDKSLNIEKQQSLSYKSQLEKLLGNVRLMEIKNKRLVEEKNAIQSKFTLFEFFYKATENEIEEKIQDESLTKDELLKYFIVYKNKISTHSNEYRIIIERQKIINNVVKHVYENDISPINTNNYRGNVFTRIKKLTTELQRRIRDGPSYSIKYSTFNNSFIG